VSFVSIRIVSPRQSETWPNSAVVNKFKKGGKEPTERKNRKSRGGEERKLRKKETQAGRRKGKRRNLETSSKSLLVADLDEKANPGGKNRRKVSEDSSVDNAIR